jgi:hypothetical protein
VQTETFSKFDPGSNVGPNREFRSIEHSSVRTEAGTHTGRVASLELANVCWFIVDVVDNSLFFFCSLRPYN